MNRQIIVTGGLGFIGSNLIKLLIKKNYFVINVDKVNYASNFYNTKDFSSKKNYKFIKLDINNRSKLKKILNLYKPFAIFHHKCDSSSVLVSNGSNTNLVFKSPPPVPVQLEIFTSTSVASTALGVIEDITHPEISP